MRYKVLTTGEKIKGLRNKIGASQQDIAGDKITRNYLSQIENDKTSLSYNTAELIANKINKIAKEKEIIIDLITVEYLLETDSVQILKISYKIIKDLKLLKMKDSLDKDFDDLVRDINEFLYDYSIDDSTKCTIYELISEIYLTHFYFTSANTYIFKLADLSIKNGDYNYLVQILALLTRTFSTLEKYNEIILIGQYIEIIAKHTKIKDLDSLKKIIYNTARAYNKIEDPTNCLKCIERLENDFKFTKEQLYDINILKGSSFQNLNLYNESEKVFLDMLDNAAINENANITALALLNLAYIKAKTGEKEKANNYLEQASNIKVNGPYKEIASYESIRIYITLDNLKCIRRYSADAINDIIDSKDENELYLLANELTDYFISKNNLIELRLVAKIIENNFLNGKIKDKLCLNILYKISEYFFDYDIDYSRHLIKTANKFNKKTKNS